MADEPRINRDFTDLPAAFIAADVEFVVVGAHALATHGIVRATGDLDVLVRPTEDNARTDLLDGEALLGQDDERG